MQVSGLLAVGDLAAVLVVRDELDPDVACGDLHRAGLGAELDRGPPRTLLPGAADGLALVEEDHLARARVDRLGHVVAGRVAVAGVCQADPDDEHRVRDEPVASGRVAVLVAVLAALVAPRGGVRPAEDGVDALRGPSAREVGLRAPGEVARRHDRLLLLGLGELRHVDHQVVRRRPVTGPEVARATLGGERDPGPLHPGDRRAGCAARHDQAMGRLDDADVRGAHGTHGTRDLGKVLVEEHGKTGHAALDQLLGDEVRLLEAELRLAAVGVVDLGDQDRVFRRLAVHRLTGERPQRCELGPARHRLGVGLLRPSRRRPHTPRASGSGRPP